MQKKFLLPILILATFFINFSLVRAEDCSNIVNGTCVSSDSVFRTAGLHDSTSAFKTLIPDIDDILLNYVSFNNIDTSVYDSYSVIVAYSMSDIVGNPKYGRTNYRSIYYSLFFYKSTDKFVVYFRNNQYDLRYGIINSPKYSYGYSWYSVSTEFPNNIEYYPGNGNQAQGLLTPVRMSLSTSYYYSDNINFSNYTSDYDKLSVFYYSNRPVYDQDLSTVVASANSGSYYDLAHPDPYAQMDYIDIPITDLYDSNNQTWKPFLKYFKASNDDNSYNFHLKYIDDSSSSLPSIPLELFVNNDVVDIESYNLNVANSTYSSANGYGGGFSIGGGTFGGGGGGGRITSSDSCLLTNDYTSYTNILSNDNSYGVLILSPNSCSVLSNKTPSDFKTQYIRIYHDVNFYNSFDDVEDEYINNIDNVINGDSDPNSENYNPSSIKSAFHYFLTPIREIMLIFTTFYNALPLKLKLLLIAIFVVTIYLVVVRFIL